MAYEAQTAVAATLNQSEAKETRQRTDRDVRRLQEGRPSRAGPSATTSLLRADAEKLTAQIIRETGDVPINPKVKPLVDSLNRAGVPTKMSGDLYGKPILYVDLPGGHYVQGTFSDPLGVNPITCASTRGSSPLFKSFL